MYTSQQASYKALPSSTRSRRVSGNYTAASRPGLNQAAFRPNGSVVSTHSSNASSVASGASGLSSAAVLGPGPSSGVTLQSWARSQYHQQNQQFQQQQFHPRSRIDTPESPSPQKPPTYQAHYQYSSRNAPSSSAQLRPQSSSNAVQFAVADYFDPYRGSSQGQTLSVSGGPAAAAQKPKAEPPRHHQQQQQQQQTQTQTQQTPPSPLMRAVRHSRPTTPQTSAPPSAQSSTDSLRTPTKPPSTQQQQPKFFSPQAVRTPQPFEPARLKPRSSTTTEDSDNATQVAKLVDADPLRPRPLPMPTPTKPRVASMYAAGASPSSAGLYVEMARTPQRASIQSAVIATTTPSGSRAQHTSGLAHAAIRDLVDMRAPLVHKQQQQPRAAERTERSELIDFIERRRAQTVTTDIPAAQPKPMPQVSDAESHCSSTSTLPKPERPESVSSRQSDTSERSFKRSTARLMDVDTQPMALKTGPVPKYKHTSWYGMPGQKPDLVFAKPDALTPTASAATNAHDKTNSGGSKPGPGSAGPLLLPPQSSRIVPRNRAQTLVSPTGAAEPSLATQPQSNVFARPARLRTPSPNPYSRNPSAMSVAVQTVEHQPPRKPTASRGVQASSGNIHGDDAVLDLMRQMDSLRTGHANQISEYQEHVIDLELLTQDLQTEVDQLTARLEAKEASHKKTLDEMRGKLEDTRQRVDREIADVKKMHASKCNELADQVTMLLDRCEKYRHRLVQMGVTEDELLRLAAGTAKSKAVEMRPGQPIEQLSIVDSAFIETQYVETRESSQEADYFKQLMDIERSMENTTIALGFELKRTQAKYLQQAADFIREQMVRFQQPDGRSPEPRGSSGSRAVSSPAQTETPTMRGSPAASDNPPTLPAVQPLSPVLSLTASLSQLGRPPVPPGIPTASASLASTAMRPQPHRRVAGPLTSESQPTIPTSIESIPEGTGDRSPLSTAKPAPVANAPSYPSLSTRQRQRANSTATFSAMSATLPTYSPRLLDIAGLGIDRQQMRGFDSEGRQSGLARIVNPGGSTRMRSSTINTVLLGSDDGSESDSPISSGSPRSRRAHRSPLAGIASGFFASSQESMNTLTGSAEPLDTHPQQQQQQQPTSATTTIFTPTSNSSSSSSSKPQSIKHPSNTIGYSTAQRKADPIRPQTPIKSSTMHWPHQLHQRRSAVLDPVDMTAEELLQSLKLPSTINSSRITGSLTSSPIMTPNGSLGRHSPIPRTSSFTDISYSPTRNRGSIADSPSSDLTLPPPASTVASLLNHQPVRFDPKTEINLNLGLDSKPSHSSINASRRNRRGHVQRRRSRSVGTWDRAASSSIFASIDQQ